MKNKIKSVPEDFPTITPYLIVRRASDAVKFYRDVFGAHEFVRGEVSDRIMHCEMIVGNSRFFVKDEVPEWGAVAPQSWSVTHYLYVEDSDEVYKKAIDAGATSISEVAESMWGDRCGVIRDPFGHVWCIASRVEDLSPEQWNLKGQISASSFRNT